MDRWEKAAARRLQRNIDGLVKRLRDTADEVERECKQDIADVGNRANDAATYARAAERTVNALHALIFNAGASNIINAASDADTARLTAEEAP